MSKIYKEATFEAAIEHHLITDGATSAATLTHSTASSALIPPYSYHLFCPGARPFAIYLNEAEDSFLAAKRQGGAVHTMAATGYI